MASKYLTSGTAAWTGSTRAISAATNMSSAFDSSDETYQRQIVFILAGSVYFAPIEKYVAADSVRLLKTGVLPAGDGSITQLTLLDLGTQHIYQSYYDRVSALIKDAAGSLDSSDVDAAIDQAVNQYGQDVPIYVAKKVQGTGSSDYVLSTVFGSLWVKGYSIIRAIEYPVGQKPLAILDDDEWGIYDDGTAQDGSNLILRFGDYSPAVSEYFNAEILTPRNLPKVGTPNYPDNRADFINISLIAASIGCTMLAAKYAQSINKAISVDSIDYDAKTRKYLDLAKSYRNLYNRAVFGEEQPKNEVAAAIVDKDIDLVSGSGYPFLFHGGRNR